MTRRDWLAGLLATAALTACRADEQGGRVDPRAYDSFFLWAGVRAPEWLDTARNVYALAGEVRHGDPVRYVPLRAVPRLSGRGVPGPELWLTVRVERLDWSEEVYAAVLGDLQRWQAAGNRVAGMQIDFDAATRGLAGYAAFLSGFKARLPVGCLLSITGLLDWSAGGDPAALAALADTVDEVVVQTYQGRHTIPGYDNYLDRLRSLPMPWRVALVEGGAWQAPPWLAAEPQFRGYVVFLLNP